MLFTFTCIYIQMDEEITKFENSNQQLFMLGNVALMFTNRSDSS